MKNNDIGQFNVDLDFDQLGEEFWSEVFGEQPSTANTKRRGKHGRLNKAQQRVVQKCLDSVKPWSEAHVVGYKIV